MAENKIKVNELQTATPQLNDTLLASGAEREYACRISDLKDAIGGGGGLNNAKDAENGGIVEGLINGNDGEVNVANGLNAHAEGGAILTDEDSGQTDYYPATASGDSSHAEGASTASGWVAHAEGYGTTASGESSHAEGHSTTASGENSHAEGDYTTASSMDSHAEGQMTNASGTTSHAEGFHTSATNNSSHAEGSSTTASGLYAHAEGSGTTASGDNSHAEGLGTTANHLAQHVFGKYNIDDPSTDSANRRGNYVEIVGNGDSYYYKSNARTLDWNGNEWIKGKMTADLGIVLKSPDGSSYTLTMNNDGTLKITKNT